jgi:hypothetical protein
VSAQIDFVILGLTIAGALLLLIIIILILWKVKLHKLVAMSIVGIHASVLQVNIP